jgi:peptidoglycan-associated lipoprotein
VTSGPLRGRSLRLVGRADPRGELEYNFALGSARAGSVDAYLTNLGLDSARVSMTSRGKLDATGTNESGWQRDRRVDVDLL